MKNLLLIQILLFSIFSIGQIPTDGMLFHYQFNGNANDDSPYEHHAMVDGASLVTDRYGNAESAYYFDGVDDIIALPNVDALKPDLQVTFSLWVKPLSHEILSNKYIDTDMAFNNYGGYWISLSPANDGRIVISYGGVDGVANPTNRRSYFSDNSVNIDEWNHIVCVVRAHDDMSIYINCRDVENGTYTGTGATAVGHSSSGGYIGSESGNTGHPADVFFNGTLDDFIFWDRALTEKEISDLCTHYDTYTSIDETEMAELSIYPNPANEITSIEFSSKTKTEGTITIYNMLGEVVETNNIQVIEGNNIQEISVGDYETGSYIIQIQLGEAILTSKLEVIK
jgi:hypothetical protein